MEVDGPPAKEFKLIRRAKAIVLPQAGAKDLYHACEDSSALLFPNYDKRYGYEGKIGQLRLFREMGWPHPVTMHWPDIRRFWEEHGSEGTIPHRLPFLVKRNRGHEGEGVYLIRGLSDLKGALEDVHRKGDSEFLTQELVPSEGNVLRVVIMGKRSYMYWKRSASPNRLITTIGSGSVIDESWRADLQKKGALRARQISEEAGINLAALDFVFPLDRPDPHPLILEINYYFGRRGLGGSLRYYRLLMDAVREWLSDNGLDPMSVWLG